jgi:predicted nucleic acid-binding protein
MIFVDTNVFLDVLEDRDEWYAASSKIVNYVETKKDKGSISALTAPTLWYAMHERRESIEKIRSIVRHFKIVSLNAYILNLSFKTDMDDFEDAIQLNSALQAEAKYLITRNKRDFPADAKVDILTPEEFLEKQAK